MPSGKRCWLIKSGSLLRSLAFNLLALALLAACYPTPGPPPPATLTPSLAASPVPASVQPTVVSSTPTATASPQPSPTASKTAVPTSSSTPTPVPLVPPFSHIGIIVLENREFGSVIGNRDMPVFNQWASQYTLLEQHYAVAHPSLPNYLALLGGDTFQVTNDCTECFINAPSLPDLLEASGRTWKSYQEDLPSPCFIGNSLTYYQKHNPFVYFDPIRLDAARCQSKVVNLEELQTDLADHALPDFFFITPNICNDAHDCDLRTADIWLGKLVPYLLAYPDMQRDGLLIITWDEGQGEHGCCGIEPAGGRVATILLSPLARPGFKDETPYTHYSILKTIAQAWGLPELGHAADESTALIRAPWER